MNRFSTSFLTELDSHHGWDQLEFALKSNPQCRDVSYSLEKTRASVETDFGKNEILKGRILSTDYVAETLARIAIYMEKPSEEEAKLRVVNSFAKVVSFPQKINKKAHLRSCFTSELVDYVAHNPGANLYVGCSLIRFLTPRHSCNLVAGWLDELGVGFEKKDSKHANRLTCVGNSLKKTYERWNNRQRAGYERGVYTDEVLLTGKPRQKFGYVISCDDEERRAAFAHKVDIPLTSWEYSAFNLYKPAFQYALERTGHSTTLEEGNLKQLIQIAQSHFKLPMNAKNFARGRLLGSELRVL